MEINYHSQFLLDKEKDSTTGKIRFRIKWDKNIIAFGVGHRAEFDCKSSAKSGLNY